MHIQGQQDDKKPGEYHSIEFATLYKGTIEKIVHDNFGIDSEHTKKGSLLTIDCPTITILESQLNNKIVVKDPAVTVVTTVTAIEEGGTDNYDKNCDNQQEKIDQNNANPLLREPSLLSHPSPCSISGEPLRPLLCQNSINVKGLTSGKIPWAKNIIT